MVKGPKITIEERIEIVSYCIANNKEYGKTVGKFNVAYPQIYGCDIPRLNRSSYYKWLHRDGSAQEIKNAELIEKIYALYQKSNVMIQDVLRCYLRRGLYVVRSLATNHRLHPKGSHEPVDTLYVTMKVVK